ncbi:dipeptide ABC transporter ATP-binding protein [Actinoplanes rectilineatus]|uniref:dipeptide ABC transporter ATP-binding protein n=1 Tax=Actinoplanes rectilineatus TaxID=113571 RepID=UPI0005F28656|nr:ABC transporter ATP-binding protein [Actinoplanes rectilineatus]
MTETTVSPLLAVADLAISFDTGDGGHQAARGVAFQLHRGRVLALVGESGSGKSVTAMSILGLLPGNARVAGSLLFEDEELIGCGPEKLRALRGGRIGTVFQEPMAAFNPVLTLGDQIAEAIHTHKIFEGTSVKLRVRQLLTTVGLDDPDRVARSYPHQLSGGQLQRAMIAMAISGDPVLLIADEPTTALDVTAQAGILDLLRELRDDRGMAILLITHDMGVVADLADDVVVLDRGRVVETAPAGRLFTEPAHAYTKALLEAVPRLGDPRPAPEPGPEVAAVGDLVVEYGRFRAVDGVTLRVGAGEVVGLVGESGSGKSTVGRVLAGLVPVTAGTATVGGADLTRLTRHPWRHARALRRLRAGIGVVFQDPASSLNPRRTVGDSITEPLVLHRDLDAAARRARVEELLDAVRLPAGLRTRYPHEMSGGQRQRVAIARALALNPALLIADEPTSALDVSVQARILDLLRSLQRDFGFGCLFVSHDLAVVEQVAHRVAVMHRGTLVEEGTSGEVLHRAQHPYTRKLLAAVPVADPVRQAARRVARTAGVP